MKASCLQENLNKGLNIVSRVVSSKAQIPVLNNILIASDQNRLKLSAANLETGINFWIGAKIEEEGALTVPARPLVELVTSLPAGKVDLEAAAELLKISAGFYKASLNGLPASEFPPLGVSHKNKPLSFSAAFFGQAISQVAFAAAQDEGRPVLTGVKWVKDKEGLSLAATDGYRLSFKKTSLEADLLGEELIVPARALLEVAHISQEKEEGGEEERLSMFFSPGENQVSFSLKDAEIITRLIEGEFPDFSKIIPQGFATKVTLEKEALLKATKIASIFARDSANIVKWQIEKDKVIFSANSPQVGENSSEVEAKVEGEKGEIAFNFRFLLDFLGGVKSEEIIFETSGPLNPGVFRPADDKSFLHIIMPVRVQG